MRTPYGSIVVFCTISAMFLVELAIGADGSDARLLNLGALPDNGQLHHEYWRVFSFGLLHWDAMHLALNCLLLLLVGPFVERRIGTLWLLCVFLATSVASGVGILIKHQLWPSQGASVGASGGMFGLLGAALILLVRLPPQSARSRGVLVLVLIVGITYSIFPGISMTGHIVGILVGAAIGAFIPLSQLNRST